MRDSANVQAPVEKKAIIAMSGGVDSSVAAKLLRERGDVCVGCTMKLYHNEDIGLSRGHTCCSLDDVEDARSVAWGLGMDYYVFNLSQDFRDKVMEPFARSYCRGETPNPCIDCNRCLKFARLFDRADDLGCQYVATGHYARIEEQNGRFVLKKALDESKDQSYVLYAMTQAQLARTLFPLGELSKPQVRALAEEGRFGNAHKPDSQDICFAPDGDYASAIGRILGSVPPPGDFVDREGRVLGRHRGIIHYTLGQHRGLGVSLGERQYVLAIRPDKNQVVLGPESALFHRGDSQGAHPSPRQAALPPARAARSGRPAGGRGRAPALRRAPAGPHAGPGRRLLRRGRGAGGRRPPPGGVRAQRPFFPKNCPKRRKKDPFPSQTGRTWVFVVGKTAC